jgi:long-subunit fatty acid transport protein
MTSWQGGWAFRFKNGLSLGLAYERLYYNMDASETFESTFRYELDESSPSFTSSVYEKAASNFASDGIRFGMQVPVHEKVTLGAAAEYVFPGSGNGRWKREYHAAAVDSSERGYSVSLPPSINIGAAYRPDDRWLLAADASATLWERYENGDPGAPSRDAQRTYAVSAGACFVPAANALSSAYWEKIRYSAGLRYATLPLPQDGPAAGGAREYSLSVGAGLPIPNESGVVDLVLDVGRRTDARFAGYGENIVKFQLGINGGRNWFQKEKSRNY